MPPLQDTPLVSIIIPTYNRAHLIGETVESVLKQTYTNWELIVVDDGSEDDTEGVINSFNCKKINYIRLDHCGSLGKLRNMGIKQAAGRYIALLDSDDLWTENKLEFQIKMLTQVAEARFIFGNGKFFGAGGASEPECEALFVGNVFLPFIIERRFPFLAPSLLFEKAVITETGLFDESLKCSSEMDFFFRMSRHTVGIFSNEKLVKIRKHDQNTSASIEYGFLSFRDSLQITRKLYNEKGLTLKQYNKIAGSYHYGMGLLAMRTGRYALAYQSFLHYIATSPLIWKGWLRLMQAIAYRLFKN